MGTIQDMLFALLRGMEKGMRAIISQSYTEANVKSGLQYEVSHYESALAAGASYTIGAVVGDKPIILKAGDHTTSGEGVHIEMFSTSELVGGSPLDVHNLNGTEVAVPTTVSVILNPTAPASSEKCAADIYIVGSNTSGSHGGGAHGVIGLERIIPANSNMLVKITNINGAAEKVFSYFTWYEGKTDLPLS